MQAIFRKYDLRGIVGTQFHIQDSYQITQAIITYFKQKFPDLKNVAVGMDGRTSSPAIKTLVCKALVDAGLNAHFIGICPTPAMYFACHTLKVDAGIMITASHNPKEYNGFKLVLQKESIWGADIEAIKEICLTKSFYTSSNTGNLIEHDIIDSYIDSFAQEFKHLIGNNLNFVIDCGNGVGGAVIPKLVTKMQWQNVAVLYAEIDGDYPNHNPNPVELKNMLDVRSYLASNPYCNFGVGLDGDGDRVGAMTKAGYLIPGDLLLGIFALNMDKKYNPAVVMDVKCSEAIPKILTANNIPYYISPTGHAYIKNCLKEQGATLGGELSGHYCFKDRHFGFDDGIYAILRLCEILVQTKNSLKSFLAKFPKTYCSPEFRIPCKESQKNLIIKDTKDTCSLWPNTKIIALDGVRVQTKDGWAIVRAANTEPAISMRIEGYSEQALIKLKQDFFKILSKHLDNQQLITTMNL
jgi:phosphomannomutase/phosphoglucomutase